LLLHSIIAQFKVKYNTNYTEGNI